MSETAQQLINRLKTALIIVDVQTGFADTTWWGPRNNPDAEANIAALLAQWQSTSQPVVFIRHDSTTAGSPLSPGQPGNDFQDILTGAPDLLVRKSVNSSFHGTPDLHAWLQDNAVEAIVVCGITTNHCCETTARVGSNLGYQVLFPLDATYTFDRCAPDGTVVPAEDIAYMTAVNLHQEFATIVTTVDLLPVPHRTQHRPMAEPPPRHRGSRANRRNGGTRRPKTSLARWPLTGHM